MKVVARRPCNVGGKSYSTGDIIDIKPEEFQNHRMMLHGQMTQQVDVENLYMLGPTEIKVLEYYAQLEEYLEEKGINFLLGETIDLKDHIYDVTVRGTGSSNPNKPYSLLMTEVPKRLYHEVIVPGILEFCKKRKITIKAMEYLIEEEGRALWLQLMCKPKKIPNKNGDILLGLN